MSPHRRQAPARSRGWRHLLGGVAVAALVGTSGLLAAAPAAALAPMSAAEQCTASTRIDQPVPALSFMQSDLAWGITRGAGVTVAVVDSGVNAANPHLAGVVVGGIDLVGDGGAPDGTTDVYGHGTAIAGQIAAQKIDGSGVVGLAPEADILAVRVFGGVDQRQIEAGFGPSPSRLAAGIRWAADQGAQIINVSMSTTSNGPELADAVAYAAARGSLVVGSAGNRNNVLSIEQSEADVARYPAGSPGVLGVAAADLDGVVTDASIHGPHVSIAALGQGILTASAIGGDCTYAGEEPATSYAAGYVSAAAALVAAAHPDETPEQWAYRLTATAVRADPDRREDGAGWGMVQPYDAMVLIPGEGIRGPLSPFAAGAGAPPTDAAADPVRVVHRTPVDAEAVWLGATAGIGGLILLAGIGALGVFVSRRRAEAHATPQRTGRGLYGDRSADAS